MTKQIKNKIEIMKDKLSFIEVLNDIMVVEKKYNNFKCPFCRKLGTFSILHDEYGKCFYDKCEWQGDVIELYKDFHNIDLKSALEQLDMEYDLNIDVDVFSKEKLEIERGKYFKRIADIKFIRQFRVMLEVMNYSRNDIVSIFNVNRKYISIILNENIDHVDLSEKRYNVILNLMIEFYKENQKEMLFKMDLYFKDETVMLDPNVKTVFPPTLGITAQPRVARAERSLHIAQAKRGQPGQTCPALVMQPF